MIKDFQRLGQSIGIYTVINVVTKLFPFLLLPILSRYLSPAEFGRSALFIATSSLLIPLVGLRGDAVVVKALGEANAPSNGPTPADARLDLALTLPFVIAGVLLLVLLAANALGWRVDHVLGLPAPWIALAVLTALLWNFTMIHNATLQIRQRFAAYATLQVTQAVGIFALTAALVCGPLASAEGRNLGYSVPILAVGSWCCWTLLRQHGVSLRWPAQAFKRFAGISFPLLGGTLASLFASTVDRYAVSWFFGVESLGIYAFGVTLGLVLAVLTEGIELAWLPYVSKSLKEPLAMQRLRKTGLLILLGLVVCALLYAALLPHVVQWVGQGERYAGATPVAWATLTAVLGKAAFNLFSTVAIYAGRPHLSLKANLGLAFILPGGIWLSAQSNNLTLPQYAIGAIYLIAALFYFITNLRIQQAS